MRWREMLKLAVDAARTEAKLAAEKVGDWLAESPVAPSSPAPAVTKGPNYESDTCECDSPKLPGWAFCPSCVEKKCLPATKKANRTKLAAYKREMEKR